MIWETVQLSKSVDELLTVEGRLQPDINVILSHIGIPDSFDLPINAGNGKQHRYVVWRRNDASA